jgi:hypothetical protein
VHNYEKWVERILSQLRRNLDSQRIEVKEGWEQRLEHVARRIADDTYYGYPDSAPGVVLLARIRQLEGQYEKLENQVASATSSIIDELNKGFNRPAIACRMRDEDMSAGIAQLIVSGGPSVQAVKRGRSEADDFLSTWLEDAEVVTILDPFLFKRENPHPDQVETDAARQAAEHRHADELLALLGTRKRVNFIYRGNPDKSNGGPQKVTQGVANRIADCLEVMALKATFYVVEDLHDRVWMKLDKKGRWHANAVGTSRGGIGRRPTYILSMEPDDCGEYLTFVHSLMDRAQQSHERPIDFKKPRSNKISNSGRTRKVGV